MATYLITGGCGFIGSHLSHKLLNKGENVRIIDNLSTGKINNVSSSCEVIVGDINNRKILKEIMYDIDGCFHLAAIPPQDEDILVENDTSACGLKNILYLAKKNNFREVIPVVYASSAIVYGDNANVQLDEKDEVRPTSSYSVDKICSELHARVANIQYHIPVTGLRLFNVYGPGQNKHSTYSKIISSMIEHLINDTPVQIQGDGQQPRDFIYIDDVVDILIKAMKKTEKGNAIYNVCSGVATSENQIFKILSSISGKSLPIINNLKQTGNIVISTGNNNHFKKNIHSKPLIDITEGIKLTYQSYIQSQQHCFPL
ncbi:MAG: NAD-dependent epimerase/dehydratase family protein [Pseudomonadota bacterium]